MWERTDRSARPAREFAEAHDLDYSGTVPAPKAHTIDALPFTEESKRHYVSGQWRGRFVQRFETGRYSVELMTMSGALPTLHVIPSGLNCGALAIEGRVASTGDPAFDRRWTIVTDNTDFAAALLTPHMREALMHPAAEGRAVSFQADQVYSWAADGGSWQNARVRLDFLAVVLGRVGEDTRRLFETSAVVAAPGAPVWVPAEVDSDGPQWAVAPMPTPPSDQLREDLSDTGEFEVSLLEATLDGTTFLPASVSSEDEQQGTWLYAPAVR